MQKSIDSNRTIHILVKDNHLFVTFQLSYHFFYLFNDES